MNLNSDSIKIRKRKRILEFPNSSSDEAGDLINCLGENADKNEKQKSNYGQKTRKTERNKGEKYYIRKHKTVPAKNLIIKTVAA